MKIHETNLLLADLGDDVAKDPLRVFDTNEARVDADHARRKLLATEQLDRRL